MQKHSPHWIMRRKVRNLRRHFAVRLPILHPGLREDVHHEYTIANRQDAGKRAVFTARDGEPSWPDHRRDRDGKNRYPAKAG